MIQNVNNLYVGTVVDIDGNAYKDCTFSRCKLRFSGTAPVSFDGCRFENTGFELAGFATLTMGFLRALYHGFGEAGPELVESLFNDVRTPISAADEKDKGTQK